MATTAAMSGVNFAQQSAQTSGNGTVLSLPPSFRNHTWIITGTGTITAGAVQIETNNTDPNDANTWAALGAATTVVSGSDLIVQQTGIFAFVRARISVALTGGGTVTVNYFGAKTY